VVGVRHLTRYSPVPVGCRPGGRKSWFGRLQDIPQYPLAAGLVDVRAGLDAVVDHTDPFVMSRLRMSGATLHSRHTPSWRALGELYFNLH